MSTSLLIALIVVGIILIASLVVWKLVFAPIAKAEMPDTREKQDEVTPETKEVILVQTNKVPDRVEEDEEILDFIPSPVPQKSERPTENRSKTGIKTPASWPAAPKRETSTLIGVSNDRTVEPINDLSNPLNPLSPISIYNQSVIDDTPTKSSYSEPDSAPSYTPPTYSAPKSEPDHTPSYSGSSHSGYSHSTPDPTPTPTHTPSHSDTSSHSSYSSPSHSSYDHSSSSSHSSYDSSSHSSSYDSGSSSYDSGSSW